MEYSSDALFCTIRRVRRLSVVVFALALLASFPAPAENGLIDSFWTTNGTVNATAISGNTLYIGGDFTYVGPSTGSWAALNTGTTGYDASWPKIVGTVYAAIPDGAGGWYLGGDITQVGDTSVSSIAHINADKSVDSGFTATADFTVWSLALVGNTLYVGGQFANLDGQPRPYLGAVDATTGALRAWNPAANSIVYTLVLSGTTLYIGGSFTSLGGMTRNRIAAIDAGSGAVTAWNPNANVGTVFTLVADGATLYAGGSFTIIGGQSRSRIAALDINTGLASAWNPSVNAAAVRCMALSGSTLYVGGGFTSIGGQPRNRIAALDTSTGLVSAWNPDASAPVRTLVVVGSTVYIGGVFTAVGGEARNHIASLDAATGAPIGWDPGASGNVYTFTVQGSQLFAGGAFTSVGGAARNHIAAIDTVSGQATDWDPNITGGCSIFTPISVHALAIDGTTIFAAGCFGAVGNTARSDIAAIDAATGLPTVWDPQITGSFLYNGVYSLAVNSSTVYAGGQFFSVGGVAHNYIAAIDKTSGIATDWNPNADGQVMTMALDGPVLYAGGSFTSIGGASRNNLAQLDATTGLATFWTANADGSVDALALDGSTLYVGGGFLNINSTARAYLGAVDKTTAQVSAWSPNVDALIYALVVNGSNVYIGGDFSNINGTERYYLGSVDKISGSVTAWDPEPDTSITALTADGYRLYAGGYYDSFYPAVWSGLTAIEFTPPDAVAAPAGGIYGATQTVTLNCTDYSGNGCANLHYTLDGSTPTRASAIYSAALAITGNGTLKYFATDNDGIDGPVQSASYVIDAVAPITSASVLGGLYDDAQTVTLTCSDANSGCAATYYTTDGSAPNASSALYTGAITISANTTLKFLSVDQAGNLEAGQTENYLIDTRAPVTTPTPGAGTYDSVQSIILLCGDDNSGCAATYFTTDNSVPSLLSALYTDPFTLYMNTTVRFFSIDTAGNAESVNSVFYAINTAPVAADANLSTVEDTPLNGQLSASDLQGDALVLSIVSAPGKGQLIITDAASGVFIYTPDPDAEGADSFTFKASDARFDSNPATVTIAIAPVNDPPAVLGNGINGLIAGVGGTVSVAFGVQDVDGGDTHTYSARFASTAAAAADVGTAFMSGSTLTFTALAVGSDTLTVTVMDGDGLTSSLSLPVTVIAAVAPLQDSNADGLSNSVALILGLDPASPGGDSDADGIADALELGDLIHPSDTDGDGIIDALEVGAAADDPLELEFRASAMAAGVLSLSDLSGQALRLNGSGVLTAHNNASLGLPVYAKSQVATPDPGYDYPYGVLDFSVLTADGTATVTLQLPPSLELPEDMEVRKYGSAGWRTLTDAEIDRVNHTITLHLIDNDDVDLDPRAGIIRDPVGLTVPASGGAGGGGAMEPLWLLALLGAWHRRVRPTPAL